MLIKISGDTRDSKLTAEQGRRSLRSQYAPQIPCSTRRLHADLKRQHAAFTIKRDARCKFAYASSAERMWR